MMMTDDRMGTDAERSFSFFVPLGSAVIFLFVSLHDKFSSKTGLLLDRNMKTTQRKQENTGHVTRRLLSGGEVLLNFRFIRHLVMRR